MKIRRQWNSAKDGATIYATQNGDQTVYNDRAIPIHPEPPKDDSVE
jgi:hypothetical protein